MNFTKEDCVLVFVLISCLFISALQITRTDKISDEVSTIKRQISELTFMQRQTETRIK